MTVDVQYRYESGPVQTLIRWLELDQNGRAENICATDQTRPPLSSTIPTTRQSPMERLEEMMHYRFIVLTFLACTILTIPLWLQGQAAPAAQAPAIETTRIEGTQNVYTFYASWPNYEANLPFVLRRYCGLWGRGF